MVLSVKIWLTF